MKNLRKYIELYSEMFRCREAGDELSEDKITDEMDVLWHKEMSQEERDRANDMVFFASTEKFKAFTQSWKDFIKAKKHVKQKVYYNVVIWEEALSRYVVIRSDKNFCWESALKAEHHVLYALLRNKSLKKMFKKDKLQTGSYGGLTPHWKLHQAKWQIDWAAKDGNPKYLEPLLAPFNGTIGLNEVKVAAVKLQHIYQQTNSFKDL